MKFLARRALAATSFVVALLAVTANPAQSIVGGHDAAQGEYPAVAEITFGAFGCTGTLIAPQWVLTAGHCGSITGGTGYGTPVAWPAALINVQLGSNKSGQGRSVSVSNVYVNPGYLLVDGYDITLLKLTAPVTDITPIKVAGVSEASAWEVGDLLPIVGWGVTSEGGSSPDTLQVAAVPRIADSTCQQQVGSAFETTTQLCAAFPQGGIDTCQGDSGGPLFGTNAAGVLRVVGATSYGSGCAQAGKPGVYARVADTTLRNWIKSYAPDGVA
jgi:secreted trypsin-like serine protease